MIERVHLLNQSNEATSNRIPLILIYNRTLTNPFNYMVKKHAKVPLTEQLNDTNIDKKLRKYRLKKREDFLIKNLETLQPHGFNSELNFSNSKHLCISCVSVSQKAICRRDIKNTTSHCLILDVKFVMPFSHWKKKFLI